MAKMNVNSLITKDYRKYDDFSVRINKPNLVRRRRIPKMNANVYVIEDYENEPPSGPKKTNPNKACPERSRMGQFPKGQNERKIACRKIRPHPSKLRIKNNSLPWDQKGYNLPINPVFLAYRSNGSKCKVTEISRYLLEG